MSILDRAVNIIDRGTKLPGKVAKKSDAANDWLIGIATDLQNAAERAGGRVESNLTQNKIGSLGRKAADWISSNADTAGVLIVGFFVVFIFLLRK